MDYDSPIHCVSIAHSKDTTEDGAKRRMEKKIFHCHLFQSLIAKIRLEAEYISWKYLAPDQKFQSLIAKIRQDRR